MFFRRIPLIAAAIGLTLFFAVPIALADQHASFVAPADDDVSSQTSAHRALYADATPAPPPVTDQALATQPTAPPGAATSTTTTTTTTSNSSWFDFTPSITNVAECIAIGLGILLHWILGQAAGWLPGPIFDWITKSTLVQDALNSAANTDLAKKYVRLALTEALSVAGIHMDELGKADVKDGIVRDVIKWLQEQEPELVEWIKDTAKVKDTTVPGFISPIITQVANENAAAAAVKPAAA
jgi:hypothetical protein